MRSNLPRHDSALMQDRKASSEVALRWRIRAEFSLEERSSIAIKIEALVILAVRSCELALEGHEEGDNVQRREFNSSHMRQRSERNSKSKIHSDIQHPTPSALHPIACVAHILRMRFPRERSRTDVARCQRVEHRAGSVRVAYVVYGMWLF